MSPLNRKIFIILFFLIQSSSLKAQQFVIPDTILANTASFSLPVVAKEIANKGYYSFQFQISYNPEAVSPTGYSKENTIISNMNYQILQNFSVPGIPNTYRIVAGSTNGNIEADGILLWINFQVLTNDTISSPLFITNKYSDPKFYSQFNEIYPNVSYKQGSVILNSEYISIPEINEPGYGPYIVPVFVTDVSAENYTGYSFSLQYDTNILHAEGLYTDNTLSQNFTVSADSSAPGMLQISGTSASALAGPGTLLFLEFSRTGSAADTAKLAFTDFISNTGDTVNVRSGTVIVSAVNTGIKDRIAIVPGEFTLGDNYPNPFNPVTNIPFSIQKTDYYNLRIYDLLGRHVATIFKGIRSEGEYRASWNGFHDSGIQASSGIYFYVLASRSGEKTVKKLTFIK